MQEKSPGCFITLQIYRKPPIGSNYSTRITLFLRYRLQQIPQFFFYMTYLYVTLGGHSRTARVLLLMSIPGHMIFLAIISNLKAGHTSTTMRFVAMYLTTGFIQVSVVQESHFICLGCGRNQATYTYFWAKNFCKQKFSGFLRFSPFLSKVSVWEEN